MLLVIDLVGVFVFALAGATAGVRQRLDLFGVLVLSFASASAGGILRDLLIGAVPPAAFQDWRYLAVASLAGFITFIWHPQIERLRNPVRVFDAAGLALFAVAGTQKALAAGLHPVMAALLGMLTGIGGGVMRDLLLSRVPVVFQSDIYALAALAGAIVVVSGHALQWPPLLTAFAGALLCFGLRILAMWFNWHLPRTRAGKNLDKLPRVSTTPRIALVAGATGLVGGFLLKALLDAPEYSRVFALSRRPLGREHPKLANRIVIFERMAEQLKGLAAHDAFCCIGTTIAEAGSQEAFRDADVNAVLLFARAARAAGANRFVVVSSVGADSNSKKFYLRTKGEMEEAVSDLGFQSVDILQPSLLLGPRKALRPLEITGRIFAPLINPLLTGTREAYRAIPAETVGRAMLGAVRSGRRGVYRYTYGSIRQLSELRSAQPIPAQTAKKKPA